MMYMYALHYMLNIVNEGMRISWAIDAFEKWFYFKMQCGTKWWMKILKNDWVEDVFLDKATKLEKKLVQKYNIAV